MTNNEQTALQEQSEEQKAYFVDVVSQICVK